MNPEREARAVVEGDRGVGSMLRVLLAVALVLVVAVFAAAVVRGMDGSEPDDSSAEAGFARDMSTHHEQAVEMALLIEERTADPLIAGLAKDIMLTQQHQRGQMLAWLDLWGLAPTGTAPQMAWMGHQVEGRMPGMASPAELAALSGLSGEEADRTFLRLMIRHHDAGVTMARAILERSDHRVVRSLAAAIVESQQAEMRTMENLLSGKEGTPSASR